MIAMALILIIAASACAVAVVVVLAEWRFIWRDGDLPDRVLGTFLVAWGGAGALGFLAWAIVLLRRAGI